MPSVVVFYFPRMGSFVSPSSFPSFAIKHTEYTSSGQLIVMGDILDGCDYLAQ